MLFSKYFDNAGQKIHEQCKLPARKYKNYKAIDFVT